MTIRIWTLSRKLLVAIAASISLVAFGLSAPAHAVEAPHSAAGIVQSGATQVITLASGTTIVVDSTSTNGSGIAPRFSVGVGKGVYIYLSRRDQIANRGGICSTSTPRLEINMRVYTTTYKCVR